METLKIWGDVIPGNSSKSKTDVMEIHEEYTPEDMFVNHPGIWDKSTPRVEDMTGNDTMVYRQEIEHGPAKMTYEDEPFLVPYIAEGSDKAIVICPGGAYLTKSMEAEGRDIAAFLNEAGISAFVLWYRSYPYKDPIMFLDCQRAIRYVRFHAKEYGIDEKKIGIIGFSAGGNLAGVTSMHFRNQPISYEGYAPDEIDAIDASVQSIGLIYPAVTMTKDKIMAVVAGRDMYNNDEAGYNALAEKYDFLNNVQEQDPPMFLCSTFDDDVVPPERLTEFALKAREKKVALELHQFIDGGHGFGGCVDEQNPMFAHDRTAVQQWRALYANFVNRYMN